MCYIPGNLASSPYAVVLYYAFLINQSEMIHGAKHMGRHRIFMGTFNFFYMLHRTTTQIEKE